MFRLYVERKPGFANEAGSYLSQIKSFLGIAGVTGVRYLNRYDGKTFAAERRKSLFLHIDFITCILIL